MIELSADKVALEVLKSEVITSGSAGVYTCKFTFGADWNGFLRTAVFRAAGERWETQLDDKDECDIPWEAMQLPNCNLSVGVYGTTDSGKVLPTIWASLGTIQPGVRRGCTATPPRPVATTVGAHNVLATTHRNMMVDGNNTEVEDSSQTLAEHIVNENAHQNLIIDGNVED